MSETAPQPMPPQEVLDSAMHQPSPEELEAAERNIAIIEADEGAGVVLHEMYDRLHSENPGVQSSAQRELNDSTRANAGFLDLYSAYSRDKELVAAAGSAPVAEEVVDTTPASTSPKPPARRATNSYGYASRPAGPPPEEYDEPAPRKRGKKAPEIVVHEHDGHRVATRAAGPPPEEYDDGDAVIKITDKRAKGVDREELKEAGLIRGLRGKGEDQAAESAEEADRRKNHKRFNALREQLGLPPESQEEVDARNEETARERREQEARRAAAEVRDQEMQAVAELYDDLHSSDDAVRQQAEEDLLRLSPVDREAYDHFAAARDVRDQRARERAETPSARDEMLLGALGDFRRAQAPRRRREFSGDDKDKLRSFLDSFSRGEDDGSVPAPVEPEPGEGGPVEEDDRNERSRRRRIIAAIVGGVAVAAAGVGTYLAFKYSGGASTEFGGPIPGSGTVHQAVHHWIPLRNGSNPWEVAKEYLKNRGNKHPSNAQIEQEDAHIGRAYMKAHHLGQYSWGRWSQIARHLANGTKLRVK